MAFFLDSCRHQYRFVVWILVSDAGMSFIAAGITDHLTGNEGSAFVEVLVARSSAADDYKVHCVMLA